MTNDMLLRVDSLVKSFSSLRVINGLSFGVQNGELKAVIGPKGAGKTTLFNMITGRFSPDSGSITFQERDVTRMKPDALSRMGMARSFQLNNFFPNLTVRENIGLSVQSRVKGRTSIWRNMKRIEALGEQTEEIMHWVGLRDSRDEFAKNLSYGDQRKLEIGLALGTKPLLLLLDEPTSGMSRMESSEMIDLIKKLSERVTIILIEHDIELVMKVSDSVLVIHYGQRIAEGKPAEVEQNEDVQRVYLGGL